jgi:RNA polymerase sigma-70 factor (ECF subfamily)
MTQSEQTSRATLELVARHSYGKLIAILARGGIAAAEDAMGAALVAALEEWPKSGIPHNPEGWLLTVARRRALNRRRHEGVAAQGAQSLQLLNSALDDSAVLPDRRLELLFVCAHPAIDVAARTPLMLQTVLGLTADRIARAFQVPTVTMSQRLVRAKMRIREAGIPFRDLDDVDLSDRLPPVLDAIYAAFGQSWEDPEVTLAQEALFLADLIVAMLPEEPEALGLFSLMCHVEARRTARRSADQGFVPLQEQDMQLWSSSLIERAEAALAKAARCGRPGRYQTEAAIQSVHAAWRFGPINHTALLSLHEVLLTIAPSRAAQVSMAAALSDAGRHEEALARLDQLSEATKQGFQPYWAVRAEVLRQLGDVCAAFEAYGRAIQLADQTAIARYLEQQRTALSVRHS